MFGTVEFWIAAVVIFAVGGLAGWLLAKHMDPAEDQRRELEQRLDESQSALFAYRAEVTRHFHGTAERINRLTEEYRELHGFLAGSAIDLCGDAASGTDMPLLTSLSDSAHRAGRAGSVSAPLDYAPKRSREEPGVLSEDYDLDRLRDD